MNMMTAEHKLLFMTDDELMDLLRAVEDEQDRRRDEQRKDNKAAATWKMSAEEAHHALTGE